MTEDNGIIVPPRGLADDVAAAETRPARKSDLLREAFINSLPQPLFVRLCGDKDFSWPVYDICVETGLMRLDVCGKLDRSHFADVMQVRDDSGTTYDAEIFYNEDAD